MILRENVTLNSNLMRDKRYLVGIKSGIKKDSTTKMGLNCDRLMSYEIFTLQAFIIGYIVTSAVNNYFSELQLGLSVMFNRQKKASRI